ncbi:MAG: hypothetical protein HY321_14880 [Armatimonadetes bacterium]|nr:hypothetical protein [Armatimonadota bacterium]
MKQVLELANEVVQMFLWNGELDNALASLSHYKPLELRRLELASLLEMGIPSGTTE